MSTPRETVAEAIHAAWCGDPDACLGPASSDTYLASTYLASLAQHRDDIARVLWEHDVSQTPWSAASDAERDLYLSMTDAVLAYLTGEPS